MAGVALAEELKVVLPRSVSFNTWAGLTVGRRGDGLAAHKELQCFLSSREDLVRLDVRTEKYMRAIMEVLVHECGWGGVVRCHNWSEVGHILAQLCDEVHWFLWIRCRGQ
jgi:hypothetical protein